MAEDFDPEKFLAEDEDQFDPEKFLAEDEEDISTLESAGRGFAQGATLGFSDEGGGLLSSLVEQGMSYLPGSPESVDEQLREQGFKGDLEKRQNILERYREHRDRIREADKAAKKANEIAYGVGEVGGSLASAPLLSGLAPTKSMSTLQKIGAAAREGVTAGALVGAGTSEADLTKGEVGEFTKDVAETSLGGGLFGAGLQGLGSGIKGIVKSTKLYDPITKSYAWGAKGRELSSDAIEEQVDKLSKEIYNGIKSRIKKYSISKDKALEFADEIGVKVNAGATFDEAIQDAIDKRVYGKAAENRDEWVALLTDLKGEHSRKLQKSIKSSEKARAKELIKDPDGEIGDVETFTKDGYEGAMFTKDVRNPKTFRLEEKPKGIRIADKVQEPFDLENLSLTDLEALIKEVRESGYASEGTKRYTPDLLRKLYGLREVAAAKMKILDPKARKTDLLKRYDRQSKMLSVQDRLNMAPNPKKPQVEQKADALKSIKKFIRSSSDAGGDEKDIIENLLSGADSRFGKDVVNKSRNLEEMRKITDAIESVGGEGQSILSLVSALIPSPSKMASKAGQLKYKTKEAIGGVGDVVKSAYKKSGADATKKRILGAYKNLIEKSPEQIQDLAERLESAGGVGTQYAQTIYKAANSPKNKRTALLYGLYQQPGFREFLKNIGDIEE